MDDVSIGQRNEILDSRIDQLIYEYYELTDKEINLTIKGMKN